MAGAIGLILWVGSAILLFVAYHKIFNVVYFNIGAGCFGEIVWCVALSTILLKLWGSYWVVALLITLVLLFIVIKL